MYDCMPATSNRTFELYGEPSINRDFADSFLNHIVLDLFQYMAIKSPCTAGHSHRVLLISTQIGNQLNLSSHDIHKLKTASLLHDIGKLFIPDSILSKAGPLERYEYEIVKTHCSKGFMFLCNHIVLSEIADLVLYHHEKYDGSGYPTGKKGNDIPLLSRIISVADAYDAMTSERSYKHKLDKEEAMFELHKGRSTQFDSDIVDLFIHILEAA